MTKITKVPLIVLLVFALTLSLLSPLTSQTAEAAGYPIVWYVAPVDNAASPQYISYGNYYTTEQSTVSLEGIVKDSSTLKMTIIKRLYQADETKTSDFYYDNFKSRSTLTKSHFKSVSESGYFTTNDIYLPPGTTTQFIFEVTGENNTSSSHTVEVYREPEDFDIVYPIIDRTNVITSNFSTIEMIADGATSVDFNRINADVVTFSDRDGHKTKGFRFEAKNLKKGKNTLKFTVNQGSQKVNGQFDLNYVDTPIQGSQFKAPMGNIKAFNDQVQLQFPANTILYRNELDGINQYLSPQREIFLGIADPLDGRVDKYKYPAEKDNQIGNPNPVKTTMDRLLKEPTGRFRLVSSLFWIDAGTIKQGETDPNVILNGSGVLPYDPIAFYNRSVNDIIVPSNRGTLTLKYDPSIRQDASKYVTVFHFHTYIDSKGNHQRGWRNLGGVVNSTNNSITVPFDRFGYYAVMYMNKSFDDVLSSFAKDQLNVLYTKGYMLNTKVDAFGRDENITRGEFARILVKAFDIPVEEIGVSTFADLAKSHFGSDKINDYQYIDAAARVGIIRPGTGGKFNPNEHLTREEAAVMIARASNLKLVTDKNQAATNLGRYFTDVAKIKEPASVLAVTQQGYFSGRPNPLRPSDKKQTYFYDPSGKLKRAEAAIVAYKVLAKNRKVTN